MEEEIMTGEIQNAINSAADIPFAIWFLISFNSD